MLFSYKHFIVAHIHTHVIYIKHKLNMGKLNAYSSGYTYALHILFLISPKQISLKMTLQNVEKWKRNKLTNSVGKNRSSEPNSSSGNQEIPRINPVHAFPNDLFKIHLNIIRKVTNSL
jgi:hypothetical protein